MSLGLAGPMIGDEDFAKAYQYDYRDALNGTWWQVGVLIEGSFFVLGCLTLALCIK